MFSIGGLAVPPSIKNRLRLHFALKIFASKSNCN